MNARDAAIQRGHSLPEHPVRLPDGARVWECENCGLRAVSYDGQAFGSALEADCRGSL